MRSLSSLLFLPLLFLAQLWFAACPPTDTAEKPGAELL